MKQESPLEFVLNEMCRQGLKKPTQVEIRSAVAQYHSKFQHGRQLMLRANLSNDRDIEDASKVYAEDQTLRYIRGIRV